MYPYRVFVAYSHEDRELAVRVVDLLEQIDLRPMWDKYLLPGMPFTEQIKNGIAYAHVFLPIITTSSSHRPWVHQEMGYAMGLDVPLLPLAVGELPIGMPEQLQAIVVNTDLAGLNDRLTTKVVERVVSRAQKTPHAIAAQCARHTEERTEMIGGYARGVIELGYYGRIRQSAALTSFCIPDKQPGNPVWKERAGPLAGSREFLIKQREERVQLEMHAQAEGCDLMIDPSVMLENRVAGAREARLRILLEFLQSMPDNKIRVAVRRRDPPGNLLIVGDWFVAESLTAGQAAGYLQTVFTRHAPTVLKRLSEFDEEFEELLVESGVDPAVSRQAAIAKIEEELHR